MYIEKVVKVGVCETQPITIEGLRVVLSNHPTLALCGSRTALGLANELIGAAGPAVLLLDKGFGIQPVLDWLDANAKSKNPLSIVIWGTSLNEAESLRFLQFGARGIVRKTADTAAIVACLNAVASGTTWMDESVFCESPRTDRVTQCELTPRELEVLQLVEQGLKNREIGVELGIRPGTVKIHLKHIFEKTGVRGRYGLAFNGLKQRVGPPAAFKGEQEPETCLAG
jgi:two-component system, NarL family, nitrate/nitrite response regulator NarL